MCIKSNTHYTNILLLLYTLFKLCVGICDVYSNNNNIIIDK